MRSTLGLLTAAALASVALAVPVASAQEAPVTQARLNNADAEPANWIIPFGNYSSHRYSRLDEINVANVGDLRVAFTVPLSITMRGRNTPDNEAAPLVDGGFMYVESHSGYLHKIDMIAPRHRGLTANAEVRRRAVPHRGAAFTRTAVMAVNNAASSRQP